jgi:TonB family protein
MTRLLAGLAVLAFVAGAAVSAQDKTFVDAVPLHTVDPFVSPMVVQGGTVVLRVSVTAAGLVSDVDVVIGFPALTTAVLDAVRQWRFTPARRADRPVPTVTTVVVHVSLQRTVAPPPR